MLYFTEHLSAGKDYTECFSSLFPPPSSDKYCQSGFCRTLTFLRKTVRAPEGVAGNSGPRAAIRRPLSPPPEPPYWQRCPSLYRCRWRGGSPRLRRIVGSQLAAQTLTVVSTTGLEIAGFSSVTLWRSDGHVPDGRDDDRQRLLIESGLDLVITDSKIFLHILDLAHRQTAFRHLSSTACLVTNLVVNVKFTLTYQLFFFFLVTKKEPYQVTVVELNVNMAAAGALKCHFDVKCWVGLTVNNQM